LNQDGQRGHKTELAGNSSLRRLRSTLDCGTIVVVVVVVVVVVEEEEGGGGGEE